MFRKASIFVAEMSLLENPKLNASKFQMKKFSVLLEFTFFMSLQKIIMRKEIFCLMVGFHVIEFAGWVFICKEKGTISIVG